MQSIKHNVFNHNVLTDRKRSSDEGNEPQVQRFSAAVDTIDRMLRVGIIGLGVHGQRYARHVLHDVPELALAAVSRRDAVQGEAMARALNVKFFADPHVLIRDPHVDAVIVVTPPGSHLELARAALQAGKPVVLEKPLTQTLAEAKELVQAVQQTGVPLLLAQSLRYNVALGCARDALPRIGAVRTFTASQRLPNPQLAWQRAPSAAPLGAILNTGVHLFDLVRWMLGAEFARVHCVAHNIENPYHDDLFKVQATLRGKNTLVALEVAKCTQSRSSSLELVGEHGQLWVDYQTDAVRLLFGNKHEELRAAGPVHTIPLLLRDFASCLARGDSMPVTVQDGLRTLEVVDACYRAAQTTRVVDV